MRIDIDAVTKRYPREGTLRSAPDDPPALEDVSLSIADGETISLVGPSGCGKSSLLRVVAGLETVDVGRVRYDEFDVAEVPPADRGIGMVFQDYALYPTMKGRGNLSYFFEVRQRTEEEARARAHEVADVMGVGFDALLGQMPTTLSGGEQQRVAIARCIVRDPTLFLMDEPICNLDAKLRETTRMEIKKLLRRFGVTTLYVTHDQQEALFMGDRIAVLRDGRVAQVGTFDDLYYQPADLFVATFIGTRPMAVLSAVVEDGVARVDGASWRLPGQVAGAVAPGAVRLGVRPESWVLDPEEGAPMDVERMEQIPTEQLTLAHGKLAGAKVCAVVPQGSVADPPPRLRPDWERALFFSAGDETVLHAPGVPDFF